LLSDFRFGCSPYLFFFGALWLGLFRQLRGEWSVNDQYSCGWFVPLFAALLFWLRWEDAPKAEFRILMFAFLPLGVCANGGTRAYELQPTRPAATALRLRTAASTVSVLCRTKILVRPQAKKFREPRN
jgi:hypothetical protein